MHVDLHRRRFVLAGGAALACGSLGLSLRQLAWAEVAGADGLPPPGPAPVYQGFEDLYRAQWTWDSVVKSTHIVNCWYQRGCAWDVFVKDGIVWREEQSGVYAPTDPAVPDYNPRGCQKGGCYSQRMYDEGRIRYPIKRVGARGEGRWQRVSWEEGLREVADRIIDALVEDGPGSIVWDGGTASSGGGHGTGVFRGAHVLDTPLLDVNSDVGDHHPGAQVTVGKISFSGSMDDFFYSDLILIWGGNPVFTQIPNAHFLNEARYNGAHIVTIAPDYSASAVHADEWVPVSVGTDAALALGMCRIILDEGLEDRAFIAEQTDLPLLVRTDTGLFLRASDLEEGGADDRFHVWDTGSDSLRRCDHRSLALDGVQPALEGEYTVATPDGAVTVTPVFALLKRHLADYDAARVQAITGVGARTLAALARRIATAKAAAMVTQSNFSKFYHGLEMERCQILLMTLCGQIGRKGSGIVGFPALSIAGHETIAVSDGGYSPQLGALLLQIRNAPRALQWKMAGHTDEMIVYELAREAYRSGAHLPSNLYWYRFGLGSLLGSSARWDPTMQRELDAFLQEAYAKGWQIEPPTSRQRVFLEIGGNILRRTRGYNRLYETFVAELDLLVTLDWRMSNTALHSDYVFPAAGWYEKDDITWATPLAPYAHIVSQAVPPLGESKSDWAFVALLLKTIQQRAIERGIREFVDRAGQSRRLDEVFDEFGFHGRYDEHSDQQLLTDILEMTTNLGGIGWEELKRKGFARYTALDISLINTANATDIAPDATITANTWHTEKKLPWPTLTRRIQFYIDHPFFMEQGEQLPTHKDSPAIGGDHPLRMTGGHTRWSIHASWRDHPNLLRLQRGEPTIFINSDDALQRGIADGDLVRVFNDIDSFETRATILPGLRPGQLMQHHAWEPFQYRDGKSYAAVTASPINPLQLAGGYFHLQPLPLAATPGPSDRDTRVEIERVERA
ncbi:MAG: Dimethylsulfide dehydrogenase subunit alpha [Pseudomonadales bacterium]|nr:Dimethylsulfide dehydrogenase subunit alpha [Pseudomonadales bacterium]